MDYTSGPNDIMELKKILGVGSRDLLSCACKLYLSDGNFFTLGLVGFV